MLAVSICRFRLGGTESISWKILTIYPWRCWFRTSKIRFKTAIFRAERKFLMGPISCFNSWWALQSVRLIMMKMPNWKRCPGYPEDDSYPIELYLIDPAADPEAYSEMEQYDSGFGGACGAQKRSLYIKADGQASAKKGIRKSIMDIWPCKTQRYRSATYRPMVILLRSMPWAPQIMEEWI